MRAGQSKSTVLCFFSLGMFAIVSCGESKKEAEKKPEISVTQDYSKRCSVNLKASESTFWSSNLQIEGPWNSAVKITLMRGEICSGVAVSPSKILTAAHCFESNRGVKSLELGTAPQAVALTADDVESVQLHPEYEAKLKSGSVLKSDLTMTNFDLAVVTLKKEIQIGKEFFPKINMNHSFQSGKLISIVGFGDTGSGAGKQRFAQSHLGQDIEKAEFLGNKFENLLLLDSESGTGVCPGDSGGGVFVKGETGRFELVGIVQGMNDVLFPGYPVASCNLCPLGLGIVSSLSGHLNFLKEQKVDF